MKHSKLEANVSTIKVIGEAGVRLFMYAKQDINKGDHLNYDYN